MGLGAQRPHGGSDASPGVATDRGGAGDIPGLSYGAAAQGIRQFWRLLPADPEKEAVRGGLIHQILKL